MKRVEFIYNLPAPPSANATPDEVRKYARALAQALSKWSFQNDQRTNLDSNIDGGSPDDVYIDTAQVIDGGSV